MEMLTRVYDGDCITREAQWERVAMDRRLDDFLRPNRIVNCYFDVRRNLPPASYRWEIRIQPISPDQVRVIGTFRHREMIFP